MGFLHRLIHAGQARQTVNNPVISDTMTAETANHILTLVIQEEADIPRVRSKVKLLLRSTGAPDLLVTGLAVGASEATRMILRLYGGGNVRIFLFPLQEKTLVCGLELLFHGFSGCLPDNICPQDQEEQLALSPFPGLKKVFAAVRVSGGVQGRDIRIRCRSNSLGVAWDTVYRRLAEIRSDLFAGTEESYMENLRAKHDEVVRLLQEKTEQNQLLDQSNYELLQLSNDLEELARERAIIELSLRIADQVRNPITIIGGMARRMLEKGGLSEQNKDKISLIGVEAAKVEEMVRQFNRMAAEQRTVITRENLVALLEKAVQACPTLQQRQLGVSFVVPETPVDIHANRQVLKVALVRVLRYLTRESIVGGEMVITVTGAEKPEVTFRIQRESAELHYRNREEQEQKQEKEQEQRADSKGLPAPLELVRQIVTEHQAEVKMESDADSAAVIISFPRRFSEQAIVADGKLSQEE